MRSVFLLLVLLAPSAAAGLGIDAGPAAGQSGVVLPGDGMHTANDSLPLTPCGVDEETTWIVRVSAHGLAPTEYLHAWGDGTGDHAVLTMAFPAADLESRSPTTCMAGVILDADLVFTPIAWTVEPIARAPA